MYSYIFSNYRISRIKVRVNKKKSKGVEEIQKAIKKSSKEIESILLWSIVRIGEGGVNN